MNTPPKNAPAHLLNRYTMDGSIAMEKWYFDDSAAFNGMKYDIGQFNAMISDAKKGMSRNYPETDGLLHRALADHPIRGKTVVVMGSGNPWYEAIAVANECRHCYVIEYQKRFLDHPMVTYLTVDEYNSNPMRFDCAISISSFEHDGLGRYGDPLNPDGDIEAMKRMRSTIIDGGLLYLAIPTGTDKVVWNAHRIYGRTRLPKLLDGWEQVSMYGDGRFDADLGKDVPSQPLFILRNTWTQQR